MAPTPVVPSEAITQMGRVPATRSAEMAAPSASGRMAKRSSTAILRTFRRPMPATLASFSVAECVSVEQ